LDLISIVRILNYRKQRLMNDAKYLGLGVHQATISVTVFDAIGKLVMSILETKEKTILEFIRVKRNEIRRGPSKPQK